MTINWNPGCGILFVLSAPSGAGKTTLAQYLVKHIPDMKQSISYTTRPMRDGEVQDIDYHFIEQSMFEQMISDNSFAEYAKVHDFYYGTSYKSISDAKKRKKDLLLVIDVQGAEKIHNSGLSNVVSIFLLPPSIEILRQRLESRGTDTAERINKRIETAKKEIEECRKYDYIIVNDDLETTEKEISGIVRAERSKPERKNPKFPDFSIPPPTKGRNQQ